MKDWLLKFWANHPITTHSVAGAIATLTLLYAEVPAFHNLAVQVFAATPSWVHEVVSAGLAIYAFYNGTQNKAQ